MFGKHLKKALVVIAALAMVCALVVVPLGGSYTQKAQATDGTKDFTILHTNDESSDVIPYNMAMDYPGDGTIGGFSRLTKAIGDVKTAKAAAGEPVLTVSAGNWEGGTLFNWLETSAAPELSLMQRMGYDAVTIGNHDLELGPEYLAAELAAARANGVNLPVLSSNITFSGYPPDPSSADYTLYGFYSQTDMQRSNLYIQPYTTKVLSNGLKVGMFGMLGIEAEVLSPNAAPLTFGNVSTDYMDMVSFLNRANVAKNMVDTLRNTENCDVVVCLSHMGTETAEDFLLADIVTGIDVIIGGHSQNLNYPPIIRGRSSTIIVQAKAATEFLGNLELKYDPTVTTGPKVTVRNATVIPMDRSIDSAPVVDGIINNYLAAINANVAAATGQPGFNVLNPYAETDLSNDGGFDLNDGPPFREHNLGDLITDSYLAAANQADPANPAQFAFEANGFILAMMPKGATGAFSFYDLYRTIPLGGSPYSAVPGFPLTSFYLVGAEIQGVMETLLDLGLNDFFIQTSGLKYTYNPNAASGSKVVSVEIDNGAGVFEPVRPTSLYKLVANYGVGSYLSMFGLYPRRANGVQVTTGDTMQEFILHTGATELKAWQALANSVAGMPDLDGDGLPNIPQTYRNPQGRINGLATNFYFAEGTCRPGFVPYICIQNPGGTDASVKITYMKGDLTGNVQTLTVAKNSRTTIGLKDLFGEGVSNTYDISARVECTNSQEIICERPEYFNYQPGNKNWNGGHDVVGALSPATTFYFAEGTCRPGFDTYLTFQNPSLADQGAKITYMKGDGTTETQAPTVGKGSRLTVNVKDVLGEGDDAAHDFSAKVECPIAVTETAANAIVCERPMYFDYKGWTGGSCVVGAESTSTAFFFAEGTCRPGFDTYFCIQSPNSADASVKITYLKGDGTTAEQTISVPKCSRATVSPRDVLGTGDDAAHDFSARVESVNYVPIVVERPMYFNHQGLNGGHDVLGATYPGDAFYFAEGSCRPGFLPYLCIQNAGGSDASVKITYFKGNGTTAEQTISVPRNSRATVAPRDILGTGDDAAHDFSAKVECTNNQQIICERPMYFDYNGWTGGSCVVGCQP